jgi:hypothetical protein
MLRLVRVLFTSLLALTAVAARVTTARAQDVSEISSDERVVFFPTVSHLSQDGKSWVVPVHGWIFEPETDDALRDPAVREFRDRLGFDPADASTKLFEDRVRLFLVDNERGKRIVIRIAGETHELAPSGHDGHFGGTIHVPAVAVATFLAGEALAYEAATAEDEQRRFPGVTYCLAAEGTSVISDVDDTIKDSNVLDKRELIRNTFLRPFRVVDGMAAAYSKWAASGAAFHFVSASPWQLYEPLSTFTRQADFPEASFHLKQFRLKDSSFLNLLEDPITYKLATIESLLKRFPGRRFILVGDSGEKDPEVYGMIARKFPEQVVRVYIRDVTGEPADAARYQESFRETPRERWRLFKNAGELEWPGK